jgi:processive 1,2-diacylglycerol beta-glucosyltransferase
LSETGGGGHVVATQAIFAALEKNYEIKEFLLLQGFPGHTFYDSLAKEGRFLSLGFLTRLQYLSEFLIKRSEAQKNYIQVLENYKPDLVISVFPVANRITSLEAKKRGVPFLLIPVDIESRHYLHFIRHPGKEFRFGLLFDDHELKLKLSKHLSDENFVITGAPLRKDFGKSDTDLAPAMEKLRQELGMSPRDQVAILMMGAQGMGSSILKYSKRIAAYPHPLSRGDLHLVSLCGSNEDLKKKVEALNSSSFPGRNPRVKIHPLGRKESKDMAALMRMSQVLISKPGGSTVNEAVASGIYSLFDSATLYALPWEMRNLKYAQKRGWGERIDPEQFDLQLKRALEMNRVKAEVPGRKFKENLERVVLEMVGDGAHEG